MAPRVPPPRDPRVNVQRHDEAGGSGPVPLHPRPPRHRLSRQALDHAAVRGVRHRRRVQPPLPLPARAWHHRPFRGLRPSHPDRLRLRRSPGRGRGGARGRGHRQPRGHGGPSRRPPTRAGLDLDDDQRDRRHPARPLRGGGPPARDPGGHALRHSPERHPQGIRGPRHLHLSARALPAPRHRRHRLQRAARAALEPHFDLGLSHPRGGSDGGPGDRLHARACPRVRARGAGGRARSRPVRRADLLLLRLPLRLRGGGREVPGRAPPVGPPHEGEARRRQPQGPASALPRPDRRRDPDRPAARQQRRARGPAGAGGRARRLPEPSHQRQGRSARAAHRGRGAAGPAHAAGASPSRPGS